jgi:beta-galactosidase
VVARKGKTIVEDQITQRYQTEKWSNPAKLVVEKIEDDNDIVTVQAKLVDENNIPCLDANQWIHFSLTGDGKLFDNLGTSSGSRKVQAYNGRAIIRLKANSGKNIICVQSPGLQTVFLDLTDKKKATP